VEEDFVERVRLYDAADLAALFDAVGLVVEARFGDYGGWPPVSGGPPGDPSGPPWVSDGGKVPPPSSPGRLAPPRRGASDPHLPSDLLRTRAPRESPDPGPLRLPSRSPVPRGRPGALASTRGGTRPTRRPTWPRPARWTGASSRADRERLARILTGGGPDGPGRLQRFVDEGGYAVTTGQQPGLFGGPLFSIYKALTAAALARRLEELVGRPVLPVFWVASEDHDWEEVRRVSLPDLGNELVTLELPDREGAGQRPLHRMPLGSEIDEGPGRPPRPSSRRPTSAPASRRILPRRTGKGRPFPRPLPSSCAASSPPPASSSSRRSTPRRRPPPSRSPGRGRGGRGPGPGPRGSIERAGGRRVFHPGHDPGGGSQSLPRGDPGEGSSLRGRAREAAPSPRGADPWIWVSAGHRRPPRIRRSCRPTCSCARWSRAPSYRRWPTWPARGDAYFAQTAPVFEAHGILQPVIHPRLSAAVIETRVEKVLRKFDLELAELARPHHEVVGRVVREELPDEVRRRWGSSGVPSQGGPRRWAWRSGRWIRRWRGRWSISGTRGSPSWTTWSERSCRPGSARAGSPFSRSRRPRCSSFPPAFPRNVSSRPCTTWSATEPGRWIAGSEAAEGAVLPALERAGA
jgi:hypothetical protein